MYGYFLEALIITTSNLVCHVMSGGILTFDTMQCVEKWKIYVQRWYEQNIIEHKSDVRLFPGGIT